LTRARSAAKDGAVAVPITWVDAFTDVPFTGNPAAVCVLPAAAPAKWMQSVAHELGLAETAFVHGDSTSWQLRWFTPKAEVDLCGHATLAAAHTLWSTDQVQRFTPITFHTRSGPVYARVREDDTQWIELDFPCEPAMPADPPAGLLDALGLGRAIWIGRNRFDWLVVLDRESDVRELSPDFRSLARIEARGVIVSAAADEGTGYDFVSRFFAPALGIDEDPVTGSAHCCLGPHWGERRGQDALVGRQLSPRGGTVRMVLRGPRVALAGQAVTVLHGQLVC
jgi:PhzF family phenazine biosynthesis protein